MAARQTAIMLTQAQIAQIVQDLNINTASRVPTSIIIDGSISTQSLVSNGGNVSKSFGNPVVPITA